ncbi:MAG: hypothetical protein GY810_16825 [Aureispira sp.]|nr:hypothetical protein [Aureispira sp.]
MTDLEEKLERIADKANKLVEQNTQLKQMCEDLLSRKRRLEAENKELKKALEGKAVEVQPSDHMKEASNDTTVFANQEEFKKQIDQYIQDIDASIQWLKKL